ncbi:MAG: stage 0 sporulation protein [Eubacterium sp.]|nr:stage 0 sporulation protein [Eubacterium sp.]
MKEVIGVRFRKNGRIYYFDPRDNEVQLGTKVIVETSRGIEYGWVVLDRREVDEEMIQGGLKPIQRLATEQDEQRFITNQEKSRRAYEICIQKIREHDLKMKLVSAEYAFDNNKIMFYFTADGRVDFRELVKDLASIFRTRIELRQIGVRDESKMCGGIGICGRELCCHSYLADFIPVSIKMAKEQSLSLNPTKISGVCGRLMCCLKHEQDTYEYLNSKLPNVGDRVTAFDGVSGEVASLNVLRQKVKIYVTDEEGNKELVEYKVEELVSGPRGRRFEADEAQLDEELSELVDFVDAEAGEEKPQPRRRKNGGAEEDHKEGKQGKKRAGRGDQGERAGRGDQGERAGRGDQGERGERKNRERRDGGKKQGGFPGGKGKNRPEDRHPNNDGKQNHQNQQNQQSHNGHRRNRPNRRPENRGNRGGQGQ